MDTLNGRRRERLASIFTKGLLPGVNVDSSGEGLLSADSNQCIQVHGVVVGKERLARTGGNYDTLFRVALYGHNAVLTVVAESSYPETIAAYLKHPHQERFLDPYENQGYTRQILFDKQEVAELSKRMQASFLVVCDGDVEIVDKVPPERFTDLIAPKNVWDGIIDGDEGTKLAGQMPPSMRLLLVEGVI